MGDVPLTIAGLLQRNAKDHGDVPALISDTARLSWAELDERSRQCAAALVDRGVRRRTRVGLLAPNGLDWAVIAFAALRIGAVLVPLSTLLKAPELEQQLRIARVERLVLAGEVRGRRLHEEFAALLPVEGERAALLPALRSAWRMDDVVSWAAAEPIAGQVALALEDRTRPADDLCVMFTSGSRGTPKGVIHTHGNALRAVAASLDARCVRPGERLYIPMPFFWMGGFGSGLLTVLVAGASLLTESAPTPESTLALLERERATLFRGWPDQAAALARHPQAASTDLSALRPGSLDAVLPPDLRAKPGARANLFGMTETFGPYAGYALDADMPESAWGSCGQPFDGVSVRITSTDDGSPLPVGETGEVEVRGVNVMRGICGRSREEVFTKDGWFRTGDLGNLDADGFLFSSGRVDDMVKVKGATVYPSEVESALATIPHVTRAFVTDLDGPGGAKQVGAAVVPDAADALSVDDVIAAAKQRLSAFKVPTVVRILAPGADVPRSPTGKVDKPALQALLTIE